LPLKEGDKVKITFWGIHFHRKDYLYQWRFNFLFDFKFVLLQNSKKIMDRMLACFSHADSYIDDIIIFNLISKEHIYATFAKDV